MTSQPFLLSVLWFTVLALDGSGGSQGPVRAPAEASAWAHVSRAAALRGGMPTRIQAVTLSAGGGSAGNVQISRETDWDELLELYERNAGGAALSASLSGAFMDLPASSPEPRGAKGTIEEWGAPQLRVAVHIPGKGTKLWTGDASAAPPAVLRVAARIEGFATRGEARPALPPGAYLRAQLLSAAEARSLRRGSVDRRALAASPALAAALAQPYRLFPVRPGTNPFSPLWSRFVPGRGALEVSQGKELFQIRSFVYGAQGQ